MTEKRRLPPTPGTGKRAGRRHRKKIYGMDPVQIAGERFTDGMRGDER